MSALSNNVVIHEHGLAGRPIWIVPVVNPEGTIKFVRVNEYIQSALVTLAADPYAQVEHGQKPPVVAALKPGLAQKGWALLADLFHEENMDAAWAAFCKWILASPMATPGGQVEEFPPRYLPSTVKARRARRAAHHEAPLKIEIPELDDLAPTVVDPASPNAAMLRRRDGEATA